LAEAPGRDEELEDLEDCRQNGTKGTGGGGGGKVDRNTNSGITCYDVRTFNLSELRISERISFNRASLTE
jgi:hypothetical protein